MRRLTPEEQQEVVKKLPALVAEIERQLMVSVELRRPHTELWPLLGAARCLRLVRAMLVLHGVHMRDVIGVLSRAHYETWTAAMYVCHGGQKAVDELAADFMYYFNDLTSYLRIELPNATPEVLKRAAPKRLPMYQLATSLQECLPDAHPLKEYAAAAYKHLFAGESLFSSHGRVGSFLQHQEPLTDAIGIKLHGRESPEQLDRIWEAASLTAWLAIDAFRSNVEHLIRLVDEIGLPVYPER
jgi:hypothetical protein